MLEKESPIVSIHASNEDENLQQESGEASNLADSGTIKTVFGLTPTGTSIDKLYPHAAASNNVPLNCWNN